MHTKVLLPVDGSDYTKLMLSFLAAHNELMGGVMSTRYSPPSRQSLPMRRAFFFHITLDGYYRDQAEGVLRPVREFADQQGWKLREAHVSGHATDAIARSLRRRKST